MTLFTIERLTKLQFLCSLCILLTYEYKTILCSKPISKSLQAAWRLECELGVISDQECPVDGGWTAWESWSVCHGACDDIGHRRRKRLCTNPPPSEDGIPCSGPDEEIEPCYKTNCTVQDFRTLIEGDSMRIEAFHKLESCPALMERCLKKECQYSAIEAALASDNTWQLDPELLWNSLQCVKHNLGCPVIGEWSSWGSWSACGARCGNGLRWRIRRCDTPPPSNAQFICAGNPLEVEVCVGDQCAQDLKESVFNSDGKWSEWGVWTPCSEKCGLGIRGRRRSCLEKSVTRPAGSWGTHCVGQYNQFEVCEIEKCVLDGGWSGWGVWGPCSQNCGAGKKSRTRSCTRPEPTGGGKTCVGSKIEFGTCYLTPCEAFSHIVVVMNGESFLQYSFNKYSTLFHFYIRFMPLSPHGTLVRRGTVHNTAVRLSLQKWHVCLDAGGTEAKCTIPRICSLSVIDPAVWHSALITVTTEAATLRLDDDMVPIKASFSCDPKLQNAKMNILVGERFHGEIQEIILNFIPLDFTREHLWRTMRSDFSPSSTSNIAFEKASIEEAFLHLRNDQYLRLPCFVDQDAWRLELTLKSKRESGIILFLRDETSDSWLHMGLQNMRLKLKIAIGNFRSESSSSSECPPDQWLDIMVLKKKESNTIEASINSGERLHVVLEEETAKKWLGLYKKQEGNCSGSDRSLSCQRTIKKINQKSKLTAVSLKICNDEFFVGGAPAEATYGISEEFTPFAGIIATISINNVLQDLHDFSVERFKGGKIQVSSRTASVSASYHETAWGKSNSLNLTCLHARTARSPHTAQWFYLDTAIKNALRDKRVCSVDDGRVLRLVASADNDLRGFYTCRSHSNKRTRNIVTYGVLGKVTYNLTGPDTTTAIAVITTAFLTLITLGWLVIEGFHDLRTGFGFFRDAHYTPEEEAEAVCDYIDANMHLIQSKSAAKIAKARARRRGRHLALASRSSFAAQEPQGLMQFENQSIDESTIEDPTEESSEPEELPALPEEKASNKDVKFEVCSCEASYVSSPRHGTIMSLQTELTSSTSYDQSSPRVVCNRLTLSKRFSPRDLPKRCKSAHKHRTDNPRKVRSNLLTIKSSRMVSLSPVQKILARFQQLRTVDE